MIKVIVVGVTVFAVGLFLAKGTVIASSNIFLITLQHVLHNPMSFFDRTPTGRILSRLGKDIDIIDNALPMLLRAWIINLFAVWFSDIYSHITAHNITCISKIFYCCWWISYVFPTVGRIFATVSHSVYFNLIMYCFNSINSFIYIYTGKVFLWYFFYYTDKFYFFFSDQIIWV